MNFLQVLFSCNLVTYFRTLLSNDDMTSVKRLTSVCHAERAQIENTEA